MTETAIKERPIILRAHEVRAILEGRMTQIRRPVKPQPQSVDTATRAMVPYTGNSEFLMEHTPCPFGAPGDRLWVKETWKVVSDWFDPVGCSNYASKYLIGYKTGNKEWCTIPEKTDDRGFSAHDDLKRWSDKLGRDVDNKGAPSRPPVTMPRWASRLTLEVVDVRAERVCEITWDDAVAEGCLGYRPTQLEPMSQFREQWERDFPNHPWESTWVWVVTIKPVQS